MDSPWQADPDPPSDHSVLPTVAVAGILAEPVEAVAGGDQGSRARRLRAQPGAGPGAVELAPELVSSSSCRDRLLRRRRDELARVPLQHAAHRPPRVGGVDVDDRRDRRRRRSSFAGVGGRLILGAIVSPPDALAPLAIVRRLRLPRPASWSWKARAWPTTRRRSSLRFAVGGFPHPHVLARRARLELPAIFGGKIASGWRSASHPRASAAAAVPRIGILLSVLTPFAPSRRPRSWAGSRSSRLSRRLT